MRVILFDDLITELTDTRLVVQDLPPQEKRREEKKTSVVTGEIIAKALTLRVSTLIVTVLSLTGS
jgi:hypothetical protein